MFLFVIGDWKKKLTIFGLTLSISFVYRSLNSLYASHDSVSDICTDPLHFGSYFRVFVREWAEPRAWGSGVDTAAGFGSGGWHVFAEG